MPHLPGNGAIFGIVSENGVAKDNSPVYLLDMCRDSGVGKAKFISKQMTREDGGFSFTGLSTNYSDYSVMVSDEDGAEPKNALIQDRVQPVPVHLGAGQYADWYVRIARDGADSAIIPFPVEESIPRPYGFLTTRAHYSSPSPANPTELVDIPELPGMAGIRLITQSRIQTHSGHHLPVISGTSLEFLIDLDSFAPTSLDLVIGTTPVSGYAGNTDRAMSTGVSYRDANRGNTAFRAKITKDKQLTFYVLRAAGDTAVTAGSAIGPFNLSALSGLQHIVIIYTPAVSVDVYVGGNLLQTISTTVSPVTDASGRCAGIEVSGSSSNGLGVNCVIGPIVSYSERLTASQVMQHYKSLFNNDLVPLQTGYAAELCKDMPCWYYRFNEADVSFGIRAELAKHNAVTGAAKDYRSMVVADPTRVTYLQSSPFPGQSAYHTPSDVYFNGNVAALPGFPFNNQFTFTGWIYFDTETPGTTEAVLRFNSPYSYNRSEGDRNPAVNGWFHFNRLADKKIQIRVQIGSTLVDRTFNYTAPSKQWLNFWMVADLRTNGLEKATLFVGTENDAPVQVGEVALPNGTLFTINDYHVETSVPMATGFQAIVGQNTAGCFRDFAILPRATDLERIVEIWNSKDRP
ncbi:hypothetical protein KTI07_04210 [Acinetobacter lwoffii]|uniref:hypothetical protein n=1 Tax=Acinetobacter lwoffii TaxID=28090 RepID=UPI0021CD4AC4|nr:hypothetical protein [Acinetobacter lwoffii]MCU4438727.1 hypothetical protein [Acinetobacter lwoffii]